MERHRLAPSPQLRHLRFLALGPKRRELLLPLPLVLGGAADQGGFKDATFRLQDGSRFLADPAFCSIPWCLEEGGFQSKEAAIVLQREGVAKVRSRGRVGMCVPVALG